MIYVVSPPARSSDQFKNLLIKLALEIPFFRTPFKIIGFSNANPQSIYVETPLGTNSQDVLKFLKLQFPDLTNATVEVTTEICAINCNKFIEVVPAICEILQTNRTDHTVLTSVFNQYVTRISTPLLASSITANNKTQTAYEIQQLIFPICRLFFEVMNAITLPTRVKRDPKISTYNFIPRITSVSALVEQTVTEKPLPPCVIVTFSYQAPLSTQASDLMETYVNQLCLQLSEQPDVMCMPSITQCSANSLEIRFDNLCYRNKKSFDELIRCNLHVSFLSALFTLQSVVFINYRDLRVCSVSKDSFFKLLDDFVSAFIKREITKGVCNEVQNVQPLETLVRTLKLFAAFDDFVDDDNHLKNDAREFFKRNGDVFRAASRSKVFTDHTAHTAWLVLLAQLGHAKLVPNIFDEHYGRSVLALTKAVTNPAQQDALFACGLIYLLHRRNNALNSFADFVQISQMIDYAISINSAHPESLEYLKLILLNLVTRCDAPATVARDHLYGKLIKLANHQDRGLVSYAMITHNCLLFAREHNFLSLRDEASAALANVDEKKLTSNAISSSNTSSVDCLFYSESTSEAVPVQRHLEILTALLPLTQLNISNPHRRNAYPFEKQFNDLCKIIVRGKAHHYSQLLASMIEIAAQTKFSVQEKIIVCVLANNGALIELDKINSPKVISGYLVQLRQFIMKTEDIDQEMSQHLMCIERHLASLRFAEAKYVSDISKWVMLSETAPSSLTEEDLYEDGLRRLAMVRQFFPQVVDDHRTLRLVVKSLRQIYLQVSRSRTDEIIDEICDLHTLAMARMHPYFRDLPNQWELLSPIKRESTSEVSDESIHQQSTRSNKPTKPNKAKRIQVTDKSIAAITTKQTVVTRKSNDAEEMSTLLSTYVFPTKSWKFVTNDSRTINVSGANTKWIELEIFHRLKRLGIELQTMTETSMIFRLQPPLVADTLVWRNHFKPEEQTVAQKAEAVAVTSPMSTAIAASNHDDDGDPQIALSESVNNEELLRKVIAQFLECSLNEVGQNWTREIPLTGNRANSRFRFAISNGQSGINIHTKKQLNPLRVVRLLIDAYKAFGHHLGEFHVANTEKKIPEVFVLDRTMLIETQEMKVDVSKIKQKFAYDFADLVSGEQTAYATTRSNIIFLSNKNPSVGATKPLTFFQWRALLLSADTLPTRMEGISFHLQQLHRLLTTFDAATEVTGHNDIYRLYAVHAFQVINLLLESARALRAENIDYVNSLRQAFRHSIERLNLETFLKQTRAFFIALNEVAQLPKRTSLSMDDDRLGRSLKYFDTMIAQFDQQASSDMARIDAEFEHLKQLLREPMTFDTACDAALCCWVIHEAKKEGYYGDGIGKQIGKISAFVGHSVNQMSDTTYYSFVTDLMQLIKELESRLIDEPSIAAACR